MGRILVLYGPSTGGKSGIQKALALDGLPKIITCTSRSPRENKGEIPGVHYHFISRDAFISRVENGEFAEWTDYAGEFYGTLKESVKEVIEGDRVACVVMDLKGVQYLKKMYPSQAYAIYVGVDSLSITRRLKDRGSSTQVIQERLLKAKEETTMGYRSYADFEVRNNDDAPFGETLKQVKKKLIEWKLVFKENKAID